MGEGISVVGATDTVMNCNKELGYNSKPEGAGGGCVVRVTEPMGEELLYLSEGLEGNGALGSFGKFVDLERIGDSDRMRIGSVFNGGIGKFAIRDGDGEFGNVRDVRIHVERRGRPWGEKRMGGEGRRQCDRGEFGQNVCIVCLT